MKKQAGLAAYAVPFALLAIGGLVAWGGHRQQIKINADDIETKVDIAVYEEHKESDKTQHEQIQASLNTIQADVKELLKK